MDKKQMKTEKGRYEAPKMKVKELRHRSVICASFTDNGINDFTEDEETEI